MRSLALAGFKNEDTDKKRKEFYDQWCSAVGFEEVLGWMFLEWFRSGNITTVRELVPVSSLKFLPSAPEYSTDGSITKEDYERAVAAKKIMYSKASVPGAYTVLNPLSVYVDESGGGDERLLR